MKTYSHETYLRGMANLSEVEDNAYAWILAERDQLRAELAAAKEAIEDIERTLEIAEIPKYGSIGDRIPWNERVELLSDDRDALAADNARLRKALEAMAKRISAEEVKRLLDQQWVSRHEICTTAHPTYGEFEDLHAALAATPAQSLAAHDAAVKVAVLREVVGKLAEMCKKLERTRTHPITWEACEEWILAEADRIEKEGANGQA